MQFEDSKIKPAMKNLTLKPFHNVESSPLHHPINTGGNKVQGTKYRRAGCAVLMRNSPTNVTNIPIP